MLSKYGLLSFVIFCGFLLLAFNNHEISTQPIELPHEQRTTKKSEIKTENKSGLPTAMGTQKDPISPKSYISISEKNIFNPERRDFPTTPVGKSNPILHPQIVLYGVTIAADYQSATVANPGRPIRKDEREAFTIKIGEKIGEYKLAKIFPDRIIMESNGDNFEVFLYDPKNPKKKIEVRTDTIPSIIASPQPDPALSSGEATKPAPPQAQVATSLPFNKYTYQLLGPSAPVGRGRIFYPPPGNSAQQSLAN